MCVMGQGRGIADLGLPPPGTHLCQGDESSRTIPARLAMKCALRTIASEPSTQGHPPQGPARGEEVCPHAFLCQGRQVQAEGLDLRAHRGSVHLEGRQGTPLSKPLRPPQSTGH